MVIIMITRGAQMGKIEKCDLISEHMILNHKSEALSEKSPQGFRWTYSFFYEELENKCEITNKFSEFVVENIDLKEKNIYLFLVGSYGNDENHKIKSYYKLWKYIKKIYKTEPFVLGKEYEILFGGKIQYCSVAKVEKENLDVAVGIMLDREKNSFLYITNQEIDLYNEKLKSFFKDIVTTSSCGYSEYDYIKIYSHVRKGENIVNIMSDGEEVAVHVSNIVAL